MGRFLGHRLLGVLPVMFGVSVVIFILMHLAPGDVATVLLGPQATEAAKTELRHALGLDLPLPVQYGKWLLRTATGDFGISVATQLNVATLVLPRFLNTLLLTVASLFLSVIVGYSIGLLAALRARSVFDRITMTVTLLAGSAPAVLAGIDPRPAVRDPAALAAGLRHGRYGR